MSASSEYYTGGGSLSVVPKGLRVFPSSVNYPLIKSWLAQCLDFVFFSNFKRKNRKNGLLVRMRYIDCKTREVVRLPDGEEYVALNYVWGDVSATGMLNEQHSDPVRPPISRLSVSENAPDVIKDAIMTVKNIGLSYLWVDQCCIDQNDSTDRSILIKNMDNIYEGAFVTMVAAAGKDSSFGLPGAAVAGRPRREQSHVNIGSMSLIGSLPTAHEVICESVWATRGWTYQEAVLSRCLLIFTEYQVHFVCPTRIWSEDRASLWKDTPRLGHFCSSLVLKWSQIVETHKFRREDEALWGNPQHSEQYPTEDVRRMLGYFEHYSARHLTNEEDTLDALRGLLTRFHFFTYYGLILQDTQNRETQQPQYRHLNTMPAEFFNSLQFSYRFHEGGDCGIRCRHGFPSWAWLGWNARNAVSYHKYDRFLRDLDYWNNKLEEKATFWAEDNEGSHIPRENLLRLPGPSLVNSRVVPELSTYLWVENMVLQLQFCDAHSRLGDHHLYLEVQFHNGVRGRAESVYVSQKLDDSVPEIGHRGLELPTTLPIQSTTVGGNTYSEVPNTGVVGKYSVQSRYARNRREFDGRVSSFLARGATFCSENTTWMICTGHGTSPKGRKNRKGLGAPPPLFTYTHPNFPDSRRHISIILPHLVAVSDGLWPRK